MTHSTPLLVSSFLALSLAACGGKYVGTGDDTGPDGRGVPSDAAAWSGGGPSVGDPGGIGGGPLIDPGTPPGVSVGGQPGQGGQPGSGPLTGCSLFNQYQEESFCEEARECGNGYSYTYCEGNYCGCDVPGGFIQIQLASSETEAQCTTAHNACQEFLEATTSTEMACTPSYQDQGQGYCSTAEECNRGANLPSGTATQYLWRESWCEGSTCECFGDDNRGSTRIEFSRQISGIDDCQSTLDLCGRGNVLPPSGTACAPRYQSAERDWCNVELECSYPSTLDGEAVQISNFQQAGCQRASDNSWNCWCGGRGLNVESSTGWDACSQMAELCTL